MIQRIQIGLYGYQRYCDGRFAFCVFLWITNDKKEVFLLHLLLYIVSICRLCIISGF